MEPMLIGRQSPYHAELSELVFELARAASGLQQSLGHIARQSIADTVRGMNCYYSNLIEGHNTHPISIERALRRDFSHEPEKRNLQIEARAHIETQRWLPGLYPELARE